nr:hypothetical protein [Pirellula sp.]
STPVVFNPRPMAGRIYKRDGDSEASEERPVEVDASSRQNEPKSWWAVSNWFRREAVTPQRTEANIGIDLDESASMPKDSVKETANTSVSNSASTSSSSELPEIDWDALN